VTADEIAQAALEAAEAGANRIGHVRHNCDIYLCITVHKSMITPNFKAFGNL
jgi:hypothetical protein